MGLPLHLEELRLTIGLVVIILFIISHENLEKKKLQGEGRKSIKNTHFIVMINIYYQIYNCLHHHCQVVLRRQSGLHLLHSEDLRLTIGILSGGLSGDQDIFSSPLNELERKTRTKNTLRQQKIQNSTSKDAESYFLRVFGAVHTWPLLIDLVLQKTCQKMISQKRFYRNYKNITKDNLRVMDVGHTSICN